MILRHLFTLTCLFFCAFHFVSLVEQESPKPEHLLRNTFNLNRADAIKTSPLNHNVPLKSGEKAVESVFSASPKQDPYE